MKKQLMTRRDFGRVLVSSVVGFSGLVFGSGVQSPVVLARSDKLKRVGHAVTKEEAIRYLNRAMQRITGAATPVAAWKSLFSADEKVGIKLSCLPGPPLSSSPGVVGAVVEGLLSAGLKEKNIYIWERTDRELRRAGFYISTSGVNVLGTDHLRGGGYSEIIEVSGSVGTCFSRLMEEVHAVISVPVLKDHDIAGVSIGMKNFYGAIHNPNKFHGNRCDPYVADLCNHAYIRHKWRLTVCDATRVQVHNGPAFFPRYADDFGGLLVSRDPVALDYVGWEIIDAMRKKKGLKTLKQDGREPSYIATAAKLKLGKGDPRYIRKIVLN